MHVLNSLSHFSAVCLGFDTLRKSLSAVMRSSAAQVPVPMRCQDAGFLTRVSPMGVHKQALCLPAISTGN